MGVRLEIDEKRGKNVVPLPLPEYRPDSIKDF
jgi:hypothetical protein